MRISWNWLNDVIETSATAENVADLLTGTGLEVEGIEHYESLKGGLKGIVIGEVITCSKHPNADKLSLTTVDIGTGTLLHIVCGAPNVAAGQKVLVATVGATLYPTQGEPFEIKKSKIRGEVSEGMLCAEDELGLGESHAGILVLPEHYKTGAPASDYFPVYQDQVLEIGLTANRGDAASHLGVARDLKALKNWKLKPSPETTVLQSGKPGGGIQVDVQDTAGCIRYSGICISGIQVGESPDFIKNRLKAIGINPINNIVDITNYVLHELGQPLHAFDADKISGNKIVVRKVEPGTSFTTLDKVERKLNGTECMICDAAGPVAIGGVFGGLHSGITSATRNIFIESATFNPVSVRKTAKHHGLSTDASFRYERGTDPEVNLIALARAVNLILEHAGGSVSAALTDIYPDPVKPTPIAFSLQYLRKLIGQEIPKAEVIRILNGLDITLTEAGEWLQLEVPAYRVDVKRPADVAEEILRIYGLNTIEIPAQLKSTLSRSRDEDAYLLRNKVGHFLADNGYMELICNSLTKSAYYSEEQLKEAVYLLNPLSSDLDIMRPSMLFTGLEMIQYNVNRKSPDIKAFEFGYTYATRGNGYVETPHFALFATGKTAPESWVQPQKDTTYYDLKSMVEQVLIRSGVTAPGVNPVTDHPFLANCTQFTLNGQVLAEFGSVKSALLKPFDIDQPVWYADLFWTPIREAGTNHKIMVKAVSPFPPVRRDLALLLDTQVKYADIERIAFKAENRLLKHISVFDVYEGEKIAKGKKSYAIGFTLQDEDKTLTDKEIESVMNKLQKQFEKELGATLRS